MAWFALLENNLLQLRLDETLVDEVLPNKEDDNEEDEEVEEPKIEEDRSICSVLPLHLSEIYLCWTVSCLITHSNLPSCAR